MKPMEKDAPLDLLIVGGGINGASLARLAAFRGLKTALVEAGDFGEGASTATSKLLHGGLRYLETRDFSLVRDAARERGRLLTLAPHLVEERRFLYPETRLGRHGRLGIKAGMLLYDFLAGRLGLRPHRHLSREALRRRVPSLVREGMGGAYEYSDCVMDDARLVLENVLDAAALGAEIRNYQVFTGVEEAGDGEFLEVTVLNRLTGRETALRSRRLAFALGPFTDKVVLSEFSGQGSKVRLSQGIHLVLERLPFTESFILPVPESSRYFFLLPWKRWHLLGTTETVLDPRRPEEAGPREAEVEELLGLFRLYFPELEPKPVCTFTGIRPLAQAGGKAKETARVSREHAFHRLHDRVFAAVGGKYTTHRSLAADYLDFMDGGKGGSGKGAGGGKRRGTRGGIGMGEATGFAERPLPGSWRTPSEREAALERVTAMFPGEEGRVLEWAGRYGRRVFELLDFLKGSEEFRTVLPGARGTLQGEVLFAIEREYAKAPVDFLRRRTDAFFHPDAGLKEAEALQALFEARVPGYRLIAGETDYRLFLRKNRHSALAPSPDAEEGKNP